jgi:carbamoylphosphate synthase large subunit
MTFYVVSQGDNLNKELFEKATKKLKVPMVCIDPDTFNYLKLPKLKKGDMYYRIATTPKAREIDKLILTPDVATVYRDYYRTFTTLYSPRENEKAGISVPKTIYGITNDIKELKKYADSLGFPLIVKIMGGSHGVGVLKVDSFSSLLSVADLVVQGGGECVMREYIESTTSARLIVLGGEVISQIKYHAPKGDFRSNKSATGGLAKATKVSFSKDIQESAIRAVESYGVDFGGVDILMGKDNKHYVTEVNCPCNFSRAQVISGEPIAEKIVNYLLSKTNS